MFFHLTGYNEMTANRNDQNMLMRTKCNTEQNFTIILIQVVLQYIEVLIQYIEVVIQYIEV